MKAILLGAIALALAGCGCGKPTAEVSAPSAARPPGAAPPGQNGGVTPIGPNIGGMTPVAGGDEVGGTTGGGIAQAAKDRARNTAKDISTLPPTDDTTGQ